MNHVYIGSIFSEALARVRAADPSGMEPEARWLRSLRLASHGAGDGVSWVIFASPSEMQWGFLWEWRASLVPAEDMPSTALIDWQDFVMTSTFSAPDEAGVRWLRSPGRLIDEGLLPLDPVRDEFSDRRSASYLDGSPSPWDALPEADEQWIDIREPVGACQAGWRDSPVPARRWLASLSLDGHGQRNGASWVTFTCPETGMRWGWWWDWRARQAPGGDLRSGASADLAADLTHGGFSGPDGDDVRWLLSAHASVPAPRIPA